MEINELEAANYQPTLINDVQEAAQAIERTIDNPSTGNLIVDLELAVKLVSRLKDLSSLHPSIKDLLKLLF